MKLDVFRFLLQNFPEIDNHLMLLSGGVLPNDNGLVFACRRIEAARQGEGLECGELFAIVGYDESAGPENGAEHVDDPGMRHGNDVAALQRNVIS